MMTQAQIEAAIEPIVTQTYGDTPTTAALISELARKITDPKAQPRYGSRSREHMIMHTCWDWMTGGSTAESVARSIDMALDEIDPKPWVRLHTEDHDYHAALGIGNQTGVLLTYPELLALRDEINEILA